MLPENITYIVKYNPEENIHAVFAAPADKEHFVSRGRQWATHYNKNAKTIEFTILNDSLELTIIDVEHRSEGGRAWKVITTVNGYKLKFDLREQPLLSALTSGSCTNGKLSVGFVWEQNSSQMRLVPYSDKLSKEDSERKRIAVLPKLPVKSLKVGYTYKTKNGHKFTYFGRVDVAEKKNLHLLLEVVTDNCPPNDYLLRYNKIVDSPKFIEQISDSFDSTTTEQICKQIREAAEERFKHLCTLNGMHKNHSYYSDYERSWYFEERNLTPSQK